ncbi:MAG TPA: glycoside hydrolase family 3 N-terminal domain-containing protein [Bacteroidia bacterium]|nr:glycoside hydrolase family 3 N-terminal domain-containing protein [Bacteroidia bacterium]
MILKPNPILIRKIAYLFLFLSLVTLSLPKESAALTAPPFYSEEASVWADSVMSTLNRHERIAQLIMVAAWSNKDAAHVAEIRKLIMDWGIGGLIFFQGGPVRQANLTNDFQKLSKVPLLIGIDGEWGLSMRLDSTVRFPRQMTMAAMQDDSMIYEMGREIGRQCKRMGVHVNFAPDIDINNNFRNPVIGSRSFGDDREEVYKKSLKYMQGMQEMGVLANGKHFPGHGNADSDSHYTLPTIHQGKAELDSTELYPFRKLIEEGLGSIMVAHLSVPSLDSTPELPSTLSPHIVTGLLKNEMGFKGLIFTDALNMKAVSTCYKPGVLDKLALIAGNDILLYSEDVRKAVYEIHIAIENCEITEEEVNERVKKVLMAKYWAGLSKTPQIDTTNLLADLNTPDAVFLQRKMYEKSITTLTNKSSILPLKDLESMRIASIVIGDDKNNVFQEKLLQYGQIDVFSEDKDAPVSMFEAMAGFMANYDLIILSLHGTTMKAQTNFGIPPAARNFIDTILKSYNTIFVDFGNAYTLSQFNNLSKAKAVVIAYEDFSLTHDLAAQAVMGGATMEGRLPVNSTELFHRGAGTNTTEQIRLKYTVPEDVGISSSKLLKIDTLVAKAITEGAMPGCQIMVVKDRKVVYDKAFGTQSFSGNVPVRNSDLYDVASVTKIVSTALGVMKIYEDEGLNLNKPLSQYLPKLKSTNKKSLVLRDIMTHQAGLQSWIPFWKQTVSNGVPDTSIYHKTSSEDYFLQVADSLYMKNEYADSIMQWIYLSPLTEINKYVYSDLGPILMKELIEKESDDRFEEYLNKNFYIPLQLSNSGFKPRDQYALSRLIPTENDTAFRHQLIRGYVHDPAAAMFGGISGNAGFFSNTNDLAVIMQMLLDEGIYGGKKYLKSSTIQEFTRQQFPESTNRRALLFDKPEPDKRKSSPACLSASPRTFGHQGFTGTCVWADPEHNLIFIFLSNRINPDAGNTKLAKMNVRTDIQQVVYDAILAK